MNPLGIYFGPKIITMAECKGRRVSNTAELPQTVMAGGDLEEKMPVDIKMVETVGFFRSELKKNNIEGKEVTLCLAGQDMFVRTFEMPAMDQDELQSAINFEIEKYVPFKAEQLISDFQIRYEKQSRTNLVLYIGIKKDVLDRYLALMNQLGLKVVGVDYAGFSLLRGVQMNGGNLKGVTAVLGADFSSEDEINFMVLENGFPLFSRDIMLVGGSGAAPSDLQVPGTKRDENDTKFSIERLKTEIRVSLDYYERKYPTKIIKRLLLLSKPDCRPDMDAFCKDVGFEFHFIDLSKNIGGAFPYSLGIVKSYTAALSRELKIPVKLDILAAKEKVRATKERSFQVAKPTAVFEGISVSPKFIVFGALICAGFFGIGAYQVMPVQEALRSVIASRPKVENVNPDASAQELQSVVTEAQRKLDALNNVMKKQMYLTDPLSVIPAALPKGVWLTNFIFDKRGGPSEAASLTLEGVAYLGDNNKEFDAVYELVAQLTGNARFSKYFKVISVASITRGQMYTLPVTNFSISCKTFGEKN